jgi:ABC-type transport system involved in multi-copper enzyme maturation permease subunit
MLATFKSDIRKLLSVRSTWIILGLSLLLAGFMSFWIEGYRGLGGDPASMLQPTALPSLLHDAAGTMILFACIVVILQVGHEYRYNTIMYTLTASNSRLKVFLSKALSLLLFGWAFAAITLTFAIGSYFLGVSLRHGVLPPQDWDILLTLGRLAAYFAVYVLFSYFLASLLRSIIAAIAVLFMLPTTVEPLLGLLLKDKVAYLPTHAFDQVFSVPGMPTMLSPAKALVVSLIYLAILGLVTLVLFEKRDAN